MIKIPARLNIFEKVDSAVSADFVRNKFKHGFMRACKKFMTYALHLQRFLDRNSAGETPDRRDLT
jgi:hypothetical protein